MKIYKNYFTKILGLIIAILTFTFPINSFSQMGNVALVNGMLFETISREPIQTSIYFIDEDGNTTKSQSEINGQFQCILKLGHEYQIAIKDFLLIENNLKINLIGKNDYLELNQNFELKKISPNSEIFSLSAFSPNSNVVNSEALHQLLKLKNFLIANEKVKVNIIISAADTYFKPNKSKKKTTSNPNLEALLEKRVSNISDVLNTLKVKSHSYNIEKNYTSASKSISKTKKKKNNVKPTIDPPISTLKAEIYRISRL